MPATKELFKKYPNPIFIESGSFKGDGIQYAIDANFKTIYSIELSQDLYIQCRKRFSGNKNVHLILGDSAYQLPILLKYIDKPVTFWLDGHYSGILEGLQTSRGSEDTPLLKELDTISSHPIKIHTIIIDDLRGWYYEKCGFDILELMKKIKAINLDYSFKLENGEIENDILIAYVNINK